MLRVIFQSWHSKKVQSQQHLRFCRQLQIHTAKDIPTSLCDYDYRLNSPCKSLGMKFLYCVGDICADTHRTTHLPNRKFLPSRTGWLSLTQSSRLWPDLWSLYRPGTGQSSSLEVMSFRQFTNHKPWTVTYLVKTTFRTGKAVTGQKSPPFVVTAASATCDCYGHGPRTMHPPNSR